MALPWQLVLKRSGEPKPAKSARKDTSTPFKRTLPCCLTSPLAVYSKTFSSSSIRDRFSKSAFRPKDYNGERAQSTVLTRAPPRRPARPRWDFIFNLSMREYSKASSVVVCLHHAGERRHFRLVVSSSVGHCCQHFWVGWGPNRIKGGLRRGKCQRDANISWSASAGRR